MKISQDITQLNRYLKLFFFLLANSVAEIPGAYLTFSQPLWNKSIIHLLLITLNNSKDNPILSKPTNFKLAFMYQILPETP